ncbi:hypothetical protein Ancab_012487 [Ancistrocladus abbreviatus]
MMEIKRLNGTEKKEDEKESGTNRVSADQGEKKLEGTGTIDQTKGNVNVDEGRKTKEREDQESKRRAENKSRAHKDRMLSTKTTYGIEKMARYFINLAQLSPRMDDVISDILSKFRKKFPDLKEIEKQEDLQQLGLDGEMEKLLYEELQEESGSQKVSHEAFERWMVAYPSS